MAMQVVQAQTPNYGTAFGLLGAAAGSIVPGVGTLAGLSAGSSIGNFISSAQNAGNNTLQQPGNDEAGAMARRNLQLSTDNLSALKDAESNLSYLPENIRQQVAPTIITARMMAEQQGQGVA